MYFRRKASAGRAYLQIVESRRDGDQVRQQVIATLGRFDELQASGQLEGRGGGATVRPSTRPAREAPHLRMHWIENGDGRIYDTFLDRYLTARILRLSAIPLSRRKQAARLTAKNPALGTMENRVSVR